MKKNSLAEAPYDSDGNLLHYAGTWGNSLPGVRWLPNDPFHATLVLHGMRSGRSAKYVIWAAPNSSDTRQYPMFVADLLDLIANTPVIHRGVVSARWMVRKRGQNYGLVLAPEES